MSASVAAWNAARQIMAVLDGLTIEQRVARLAAAMPEVLRPVAVQFGPQLLRDLGEHLAEWIAYAWDGDVYAAMGMVHQSQGDGDFRQAGRAMAAAMHADARQTAQRIEAAHVALRAIVSALLSGLLALI